MTEPAKRLTPAQRAQVFADLAVRTLADLEAFAKGVLDAAAQGTFRPGRYELAEMMLSTISKAAARAAQECFDCQATLDAAIAAKTAHEAIKALRAGLEAFTTKED